jgi:hypothetical protein
MTELLELADCQRKLRDFAEVVCAGQSPLYEFVCRQMHVDAELLEIMRHTPLEQPGPNLFLAAIHFLLLEGTQHELREFYRSCIPEPRTAADAWPAFRSFCLAHRDEILAILSTGRVQTNEVRRCSHLFPAYATVHQRSPELPLATIEIGTSAGLNLNWDRYAYDYGPLGKFGDPASAVFIRCEWRGQAPRLPQGMPPVCYRVGIDLQPVDVSNRSEALWLQSLLWPEQVDRHALLKAAIAEFRRAPVRLVAGNALQVLPPEISKAPAGANLCIVHSHTLNQFSPTERAELQQIFRTASQQRPLTVISAEWIKTPTTELHITSWRDGEAMDLHQANVDHHGRWIEWRGE